MNNSYNIRKQSTGAIAQLTFNRQKYLPSRPEFIDAVVVESGKLDEALVEAASQADIGIVIYQDTPDREAAIVFANDAYCRMVGYPLEELLMMSAWDLTLARDLELIQDRYRRRQRGEYVPNVYEKTLLRKDGTLLPVENSMSTMILLGKVATVAYSRDITKHKQAQEELNQHRHQLEELVAKRTAELTVINEKLHREIIERKRITEALRASEAKLRLMFDSVSDGITVTDMEGKIVQVNKTTVRLHGYTDKKQMIGRSIFPHIILKDRERFMNSLRGLMEYTHIGNIQCSLSTVDRKVFDAELSAAVIRDASGIPVGFIAITRDITERKRAEEALWILASELKEQKTILDTIVSNSPDLFYLYDRNGRYVYASLAGAQALGRSQQQVIGKTWLELGMPPDTSEPFRTQREAVFSTEKPSRGENRNRTISGLRYYEYALNPISDNDGNIICVTATIRDITDHKEIQHKLKDLYKKERKLRKQQEEEIKRRVNFTRLLAHELKTPLTPVLAASDALLELLVEEPSLSLAKNISRGAEILNGRINELLDLAKGEIGLLHLRKKSVDMRQLLLDVADTMRPVVSISGQSLVIDLPLSMPLVNADEVRLRQILLNLIHNAHKFTPEVGVITVTARQEGKAVIVSINDTGSGIAEEEQQRLFEPYQRLNIDTDPSSGLGLGLFLCKTLVELHRGRIWVNSQPGKGSTFSFSLPILTQPNQTQEEP